jgi:hypothetical protein
LFFLLLPFILFMKYLVQVWPNFRSTFLALIALNIILPNQIIQKLFCFKNTMYVASTKKDKT